MRLNAITSCCLEKKPNINFSIYYDEIPEKIGEKNSFFLEKFYKICRWNWLIDCNDKKPWKEQYCNIDHLMKLKDFFPNIF